MTLPFKVVYGDISLIVDNTLDDLTSNGDLDHVRLEDPEYPMAAHETAIAALRAWREALAKRALETWEVE